LAVCDRILVLNEGRIVDELVGADIEDARLLTAMVGGNSKRDEDRSLLERIGE
jgi:ABC-type sugar transport system ATPase subunit